MKSENNRLSAPPRPGNYNIIKTKLMSIDYVIYHIDFIKC